MITPSELQPLLSEMWMASVGLEMSPSEREDRAGDVSRDSDVRSSSGKVETTAATNTRRKPVSFDLHLALVGLLLGVEPVGDGEGTPYPPDGRDVALVVRFARCLQHSTFLLSTATIESHFQPGKGALLEGIKPRWIPRFPLVRDRSQSSLYEVVRLGRSFHHCCSTPRIWCNDEVALEAIFSPDRLPDEPQYQRYDVHLAVMAKGGTMPSPTQLAVAEFGWDAAVTGAVDGGQIDIVLLLLKWRSAFLKIRAAMGSSTSSRIPNAKDVPTVGILDGTETSSPSREMLSHVKGSWCVWRAAAYQPNRVQHHLESYLPTEYNTFEDLKEDLLGEDGKGKKHWEMMWGLRRNVLRTDTTIYLPSQYTDKAQHKSEFQHLATPDPDDHDYSKLDALQVKFARKKKRCSIM